MALPLLAALGAGGGAAAGGAGAAGAGGAAGGMSSWLPLMGMLGGQGGGQQQGEEEGPKNFVNPNSKPMSPHPDMFNVWALMSKGGM